MQKFNPESKIIPTREAVAHALGAYDIAEFESEVITRGIANTTLRIRAHAKEYVMRIYPQARKTDAEIEFELRFQDYLRENRIPVPHVIPNANGTELTLLSIAGKRWQIILMEFVEGESKTTVHTPELVRELSELQARMHTLGGLFSPPPIPFVPWLRLEDSYAKGVNDLSVYPEETRGFIERARAFTCDLDSKLPYAYNHLDLDLDGNVIVKDNRIRGIIDFDDLAYSPIAVCLGNSLWNVLHDENMAVVRAYIESYTAIRSLMREESEALPGIMQCRNYKIGIIRLLKSGSNEYMPRILQIERELAESLFIP